jgi:hypothetical protein
LLFSLFQLGIFPFHAIRLIYDALHSIQVSVKFRAADIISRLFSRCIALIHIAIADVDVWLEHRDGVGLNAGVLARSIRAARAAQQGIEAPPPEETDRGAEESVVGLLNLVGIVDKADKVRSSPSVGYLNVL